MPGDDDEELPLGVVPVLTLGDAGFGDIDADLAAVEGVNQFGERATVVDVHLQGERNLILGEVAEKSAI